MNTTPKPACYGELFPNLAALKYNQPTNGKAFGVFVESVGVGVQCREFHVKRDEWDKCEQCPSFDGCYHLSVAKLSLWQGLIAVTG